MSPRRLITTGLLAALLAAAGCGKYGPPQRMVPRPERTVPPQASGTEAGEAEPDPAEETRP